MSRCEHGKEPWDQCYPCEAISALKAERREFCKQHLLPRTGDAELDALIRQARLQEFAKAAMQWASAAGHVYNSTEQRMNNAIHYAKALAAKLDGSETEACAGLQARITELERMVPAPCYRKLLLNAVVRWRQEIKFDPADPYNNLDFFENCEQAIEWIESLLVETPRPDSTKDTGDKHETK
jgi:hypothetical protein